MKFAEASGGRDYVSAAVADDLIHGACQLGGIHRVLRVRPVAVLRGKRRHHRHNAFEVVGCDHVELRGNFSDRMYLTLSGFSFRRGQESSQLGLKLGESRSSRRPGTIGRLRKNSFLLNCAPGNILRRQTFGPRVTLDAVAGFAIHQSLCMTNADQLGIDDRHLEFRLQF